MAGSLIDVPRARRHSLAVSLALVLFGSLIPMATVSAAATLTSPPTGGEAISADAATSGAFTALTGPIITESMAGDLANGGTIILAVPSGFMFSPGSGAAVASGPGCTGLAASVVVVPATATATITSPSSAPCVLTFTGLQVRPTSGTPLAGGSINKTGTTGPAGPYGNLTEVAGNPILNFTSAPTGSAASSANLSPQPAVHDQDQFGNNRPGDAIAVSITPGTGTSGALLTCTTNPVFTNGSGDTTFAGCKVDKSGVSYRVRATTTAGTGTFIDSTTQFTVVAGPAHHLVFVQYPAVNTSAAPSAQPAVAVVDAAGNVVTTDNRTITLSTNQHAGTFACSGGLSMAASAGVAVFSSCTQTIVANGYTISAVAPSLSKITGAVFNVTSGLATKLMLCWGPAAPCSTTRPLR